MKVDIQIDKWFFDIENAEPYVSEYSLQEDFELPDIVKSIEVKANLGVTLSVKNYCYDTFGFAPYSFVIKNAY